MTYEYRKDPNVGRVHRESKRRSQHYLVFGWRGKFYRLTGRFALRRNDALAESCCIEDGSFLWSNEDGDHFPSFEPHPDRVWTDTIAWVPYPS